MFELYFCIFLVVVACLVVYKKRHKSPRTGEKIVLALNNAYRNGTQKVIFSWEHQFWGDLITPHHGFMSGVKNGDIVVFKAQSGMCIGYLVTELEYKSDPADMFFYKPAGVCYLRKDYKTSEDVFTYYAEDALKNEDI